MLNYNVIKDNVIKDNSIRNNVIKDKITKDKAIKGFIEYVKLSHINTESYFDGEIK